MNSNKNKVSAVVVTYNRLNLLKENLQSLEQQTFNLDKIIIINNNSTDETKNYIETKYSSNPLFEIVNLSENIGGAGGFYQGLKKAIELESEWIWLMDDDTIPNKDSLEKLMDKTNLVKDIGFLGSRVLFTDGTPHIMNNVIPSNNNFRDYQWNTFMDQGVLTLKYNSFVSCLISAEAIKKVGLPYKEFFIWGDDQEYTERIVKANFFGGLVLDSIVYHKTKNNYGVILSTADDSLAWKYYYGERNKIFLERRDRSKLKFFLWYLFYKYKINKILQKISGNKKLKHSIKKAHRDGLFFNPRIDFI